jgi:hypothetical protein
MKNKNKKLLLSFITYCFLHPEERFWQAIRNWSGAAYIFIGDKLSTEIQGGRDTFYFEDKNK